MFRGIFRIWFGGKSKSRRLSMLAHKVESPDQEDDNLPGIDDPFGEGSGPPDPTPSNRSVLAFDRNNDGTIDPSSELSLLQDAPGATTNFGALQTFDSNADDVFDANDPQFQKFGIWADDNQDGQFALGEFKTFAEMDIVSIDLAQGLIDDSVTIKRTDGTEDLLKLTYSTSVTI
jgi:hypothetical protein